MTTVIRIKYTENIVRANEAGNTSSSSESSTVERELLVNINCNIGLIADYIRESVRLEPTEEFDLWEESTSLLKNISSNDLRVSGLEVFQPNHAYLLIIVERNSSGQLINYVPMIGGGKVPRALSEIIAKIRRGSKKNSSTTMTTLRDKGGRKKSQGK